MGAVFALPWTRLPDWYDALPDLAAPRVHHRRADARRPTPSRSRRPCPGWTGSPWCSGPRVTACPTRWERVRRPPGGHPDASGHRLPQRRCRHRRRVLRLGPAEHSSPDGLILSSLLCARGVERSTGWGRPSTTSSPRCPTTPSSGSTRRASSTWNLGAEKVKGYTAEEAIGRSFAMFYTDEDRRAGLPLTLLHAGAATRAVSSTPAGGSARTAPGSGATSSSPPVHDQDGGLAGFVKVTRDLTEQHDLETALRASEERLRLLVGQVRRLRDHRPRPAGHHRDLEPRRRAGQGLHRRGDHRPQLRDVLHRRGPPRRAAAEAVDRPPESRAVSSTPAGGSARTAPASGATWSSPPCTTSRAS